MAAINYYTGLKMSIKPQTAFIDERGNFGYDLNKKDVSKYFIINAVICDSENIPNLTIEIEKIRKNNFQTGEMKSSKVGSDDIRRFKILKSIAQLDFHVYTLVIDKRKIQQSHGLSFKKSFYKFLNNLAYNELFKSYNELEIIADEHGSNEFMLSFKKYIETKNPKTLFSGSSFYFSDSKSNILIQLSDFICGSIAINFEEEKKFDYYSELFKIIGSKILRIAEWPEQYSDYIYQEDNTVKTKIDNLILDRSIFLVKDFLSNYNNSSDYDRINQCNFLKFLLFKTKFINNDKFFSTSEILENLNSFPNIKINEHYFRSKIVAKIRDEGVIISSGNKGYKIPINESDIYSYINHCNTIITPMISRIKKCRELFLLSSKNDFDILDKKEYETIKLLLDK